MNQRYVPLATNWDMELRIAKLPREIEVKVGGDQGQEVGGMLTMMWPQRRKCRKLMEVKNSTRRS